MKFKRGEWIMIVAILFFLGVCKLLQFIVEEVSKTGIGGF